LDQTRRFLFSAYYFDGLVAVHPIDENGAAGGPPVEWRSTAVKAHCFRTDPSNRYAFVPHTGESNFIAQFKFDGETGALTPNDPPRVEADEGAGPRHFLFHPDKDVVYFSNEQGGSVTAYRFDPSAGTLAAFQTVSTLPEGFTEHNHCAQINITPSGRFLYVSNRGHDSIACFAIDGDTGELTALGQQPTEQRPRAFTVDPTGNFLLAAGQESGRLASYRIDAETGKLEPLKIYDIGDNPAWVLALALPE
jgi:6-phosphogluconolactonase